MSIYLCIIRIKSVKSNTYSTLEWRCWKFLSCTMWERRASSHLDGKLILFYARGLPSGDIFPEQTPPASAVCNRPSSPPADARRENVAFIQIESSFPFDGGNVNVSFTPVLSFIMIKQFIPGERGGGGENRVQWLHSSPVLFHSHACDSLSCSSQRPSRGRLALKQISHILLFDFVPFPRRLSY